MKGMNDLIAEHDLFAGLARSTVSLLGGCARNEVYAAGERLFSEGEPADCFWLIRHGRVAIEVASAGVGQVIIETVGAGDVVGWSWLVPPYKWHFDAVAQTRTRTTVFDVRCVRTKLDADPGLGYELMSRFLPIVVDRLQATRLRLLDLYGTVSARV